MRWLGHSLMIVLAWAMLGVADETGNWRFAVAAGIAALWSVLLLLGRDAS